MSKFRILTAAAAALVLAGCASSGAPKSAAAQSRTALERAVERWQAIIDGKPEVAWEMLTPGVRSARPLDVYVKDRREKPVVYRLVEPVDEICDADACTVTVELQYDVRIPLAGVGEQRVGAVVEERWIRLDGAWYHLPDDFR